MRKLTACVLTMTLLLSGCRAERAGVSPEESALALRQLYQALAGWSASADISVCYTDTVYAFSLDAQWQRDGETVLAITAPDTVAGITARIAQGETVLEYDGAGLSLGLLDDTGLTPASLLPALMEQIEKGYMAECAWAGESGEFLQITFQDPEREEGKGTRFLLTFDREGYALRSAEVSVDGATVLTAAIQNFTMTPQS